MKLNQDLVELLMEHAIAEAVKGAQSGEVPIGAVIAYRGEIIARAHNLVETRKDISAHAELLAMREAGEKLDNWRLDDTVMCVTIEPCTMCIGAIRQARVPVVVFGAEEPRTGACGSLYDLSRDSRLGSEPRVIRGVQSKVCRELLSEFFEKRRNEVQVAKVFH